jgi:hypothetical protein
MKVNEPRHKELIPLAFPVLALAGLAIVLPAGNGPTLILEKTQVGMKPPSFGRKSYEKNEFDTQVKVVVKYNAPTLYKRYSSLPTVKVDTPSLVDETGRNWATGHEVMAGWSEDDQPRYHVDFGFAVSGAPLSIKRLTLKSNVTVDNSSILPIAVVVWDRT